MNRCYVIAEAGVNHNGSLTMAKQLVDAARNAGADAVKFQTFSAESLVVPAARKAQYQAIRTGEHGGQFDMLKALELSHSDFMNLAEHSRQAGIEFLSTAFDPAALEFLTRIAGVRYVKVPSGEITNLRLLLAAGHTGLPVLLSTGMANMGEIDAAIAALCHGAAEGGREPMSIDELTAARTSAAGRSLLERLTLLHCTTAYPVPSEQANLRAMDAMRAQFRVPIGYSDHTMGINASLAAAARGAVVIEKHITLDRNLPGPDHKASLEPDEFAVMVSSIREICKMLGTGEKVAMPAELENIDVARRSVVAARDIAEGEVFTPEMVDVKRPGGGLSPMRVWELYGTAARCNYRVNDKIIL